MNVGDIIRPNMGSTSEGSNIMHSGQAFAYATPNYHYAHKVAGLRASDSGRLFGHVYTVEPLENDDSLSQEDHPNFAEATSTKGFRVTGVHSMVPNMTPAEVMAYGKEHNK
jgi:hypothetical protein